jgi:cellulose synthase (UDP-forming)
VKDLCRKLGASHFSRKPLAQYHTERGPFQAHSKHGNYNAWLHEIGFARYDLIAAFDPDHIPVPTFLSQVVGYFSHPMVGYVQAPQTYYNQSASFIARGAAEETYAYYSSVQMASYGLGYPIVIGSHNTHRVSALKDVGGFAPHDADDLLITFLYRSRGWQGVYVPKILARGLTPVDWSGYLGQQRRWARSVLDLKIRSYPKVSGRLPLKTQLMSLLHGLNYLHKSLLLPAALIVLAVLLATGMAAEVFSGPTLLRLGILTGAVQLAELYRQRFYLEWKTEWGLHWRAGLLQLAKWPYLLSALFDVIQDRRVPYTLTTKVKSTSRRRMMWPQAVVAAFVGSAWAMGILSGAPITPFLHLTAAAAIAGSLFLLLTERWTFPAPYTTGALKSPDSSTTLRATSVIEAP